MHPIVLILAAVCAPLAAQGPAVQRRMAMTFDDLPNGGAAMPLEQVQSMTRKLLAALKAAHAPAIGFVNGEKVEVEGEKEQRLAVLNMWLDAGFPLGNHTYSHPDINTTPGLSYQQDILRCEELIQPLMKARGMEVQWFRHPFTHTGPDQQARDTLDGFLKHRGYRVAPFTVEQSDYVFEAIYRRALARGDEALAGRIRKEYLDYTDRMVQWFEHVSQETLEYEVSQILLLHANQLNADVMEEMLARLKKRGYTFVTLDETLKDMAYMKVDRYVGKFGPSWLYRWTAGTNAPNLMRNEPDPPSWVVQMYQEQTK
jgi:peptidoglycan/xylan/chitin deacetylase (PgdA/CDA1 family)